MEDLQNLQEQETSSSAESHETETNEAAAPVSQPETNVGTSNSENIRQLRLAKEKAEREREEYYRRLQEYEAQKEKAAEAEKQQRHKDPSDLAEYQDLLELRKEMENQRIAQEQLTTEIKLRQSFPDIDQVLSAENIAKFKEQEPELAAILNENKNMYTKASVAYKYIKKMGLGSDDQYKAEKDRIAENAAKPKTSYSAAKDTPLSHVNEFAGDRDARRKHVWQQMKEAIENR